MWKRHEPILKYELNHLYDNVTRQSRYDLTHCEDTKIHFTLPKESEIGNAETYAPRCAHASVTSSGQDLFLNAIVEWWSLRARVPLVVRAGVAGRRRTVAVHCPKYQSPQL
ncbi:hypothetical protein K1T71_013384 [Dendrolimus kikuchii]|uniref:Uncharacterized protein n=1 Tax=Dendrolimus kikuchii TaxID=765133 RepID=A0ACC1CHW5_9NEOP|nr:hypothetical protein K1T71_013384 [Dendrolimus kikuchii]